MRPTNITYNLLKYIDQKHSTLELALVKEDRQKKLWILAYTLCFGIILFLNIITPMIADDFAYLYIFGEKEQVSSLSGLIRSQSTHYQKWGGRTIVHLIAQVLLQTPHLVMDILNSLAYLAFVTLIYLHIKGRSKENRLSTFILINFAIWFFIPMFGDTVLWITGSANYLWGTTIILAFLLPYRLYEGKKRSTSKQALLTVPLFLFGVIAGWTNENSAAGMLVIILSFFFYYKSNNWKIPIEYIIALLGALVGYVLMIIAPGNFARGGDSIEISLFVLAYRLFTYTQNLFLDYGLLLILYLTSLILYNRFTQKEEASAIPTSLIYLLGAVTAIYAMLFSPQFPARAWFGIATLLIIAAGIFFFRLNFEETFISKLRNSVVLIASICFLFSFYLATKDIYRIHLMNNEREMLAQEARKKGAEKCYFKRYVPQTTYVHGEDSESNFLLSYYYEVYIEFEKE